MTYHLTCINCPMGCRITADYDGKEVTNITGYTCARGKAYARSEITAPKRILTALVRLYGTQEPVSVKTSAPVPKEKINGVLAALQAVTAMRPVGIGDVLMKNICGTGADIVATETVY